MTLTWQTKTDMNRIRKNVGMVFQHFNLYANKNVLQNITLGPELVLKRDKAEVEQEARDLLKMVGLESKADSFPGELSKGPTTARGHCPQSGDEA